MHRREWGVVGGGGLQKQPRDRLDGRRNVIQMIRSISMIPIIVIVWER